MPNRRHCLTISLAIIAMLLVGSGSVRSETVITAKLHHLRIAGPREWSSFAEQPEAERLLVSFDARANPAPAALRVRQQDVKQRWHVLVNDRKLGSLRVDENDMVVYFEIPARTLQDGRNSLRIEQDQRRQTPDDIRVGQITLDPLPVDRVLNTGHINLQVLDGQTGRLSPSRITIIDAEEGFLQTAGAVSNDHLAVRPGTVYTSTGKAEFGLPAGNYVIFAGRGFEYSLATTTVHVKAGDSIAQSLSIRREVPTEGYVACDTHVHTLTHSGHGDATVQERMITLAAEGIELPIATDHNVHISHEPFAEEMGVRQYFTPVIGNEVTTRTGHFNIFPVVPGSPIPNFKSPDWKITLDNIFATPGVRVAILNHARDLHGGTRPFGPRLFNAAVGENLEGWPMRFNAMEVVNSGATQTDPLRLIRDWMALLNRGYQVTPVGSSDSHDVSRHFVGQGRTYVRCEDRDPGRIDVAQAVSNFLQGQVMASYGLLADIRVDDTYGPGDLAEVRGDTIDVRVRVLGPHWVRAEEVSLFVNGEAVESRQIRNTTERPTGVLWSGMFLLPRPSHDVHLVAFAKGPGIDGLYWRTAKPYQPDSTDWEPSVFGCSGAVWLDVDGDGQRTSARDYASRLFHDTNGDLASLAMALADYDAAVAAQAAHLLQSSGTSLLNDRSQAVIRVASAQCQQGFAAYIAAWRASQLARAEAVPTN